MKESILQYCPTTYPHILKDTKITYKGNTLKTSYLIDLMHTFIVRKFMHNRKEMNLWSVILRKKYGTHYNRYVDWLIDHNIIKLKRKWKAGFNGRSKQYELILNIYNKNITRIPNRDKFLLKKIRSFEKSEAIKLTPIYQMMIDDLKYVQLDYDKAIQAIDNELEYKLTSEDSYFKNKFSIDSIKNNVMYYTKDEYGRLHTNYTNLKKSIRNNYIKIDGKEITSLDIKNCQPKLLAKLILEKEKTLTPELTRFIESVKNNTFYNSFKHLDEYKEMSDKTRKKHVKKLTFQIFFGKNNNNKKNIQFKEVWPEVWHWIVRLKKEKQNHKHLSHLLQKMESDLVYNKICNEIKNVSSEIHLFTVHDGLFFPKEYLKIVEPIFDKYESAII